MSFIISAGVCYCVCGLFQFQSHQISFHHNFVQNEVKSVGMWNSKMILVDRWIYWHWLVYAYQPMERKNAEQCWILKKISKTIRTDTRMREVCVCVCACLSLWNGIIIIFWFHRQTQPYKSQVFFSFRHLWRSFPSCGIVNVNCDRGEFWRTRARVSVYVWCNVEAPMKKQSIIARYFGICGVKSKGISCVYCVHTAPQPFKWWTWTV